MENFLYDYLRRWNGVDHRDLILRLVTLIAPRPFEQLQTFVMSPLCPLFFSSPPSIKVYNITSKRFSSLWSCSKPKFLYSQASYIKTYTQLIKNWTQYEWLSEDKGGQLLCLSTNSTLRVCVFVSDKTTFFLLLFTHFRETLDGLCDPTAQKSLSPDKVCGPNLHVGYHKRRQ